MSLRHLSSKSGKFIFLAFATLWGYCQSFTYTPTDGYRVAARFCQYPVNNLSDVINAFVNGNAVDIYLMATNYFVHCFSSNPKVFFAILGLVFGLFCFETISSLIKEQTINDKYLSYLLILLFATNSFSWLTAPRFFTASWVAALTFLKITQGHKAWLWFSFVLPLIHFSFVPISISLILIAVFDRPIRSFPTILFWGMCVMFILSFVIPESVIGRLIPQELIEDNAKLASKTVYYEGNASDAVLKESSAYRELNGIITRGFHLLMKIGSFLTLVLLHFQEKIIRSDRRIWYTYNSVLLIAIFAFFMSILPGSGWRYIIVLLLLIYILLYRYYDRFRPASFGKSILWLYVMNIYTIAFMFYVAYRTVDIILFYAPMPFVLVHGFGFGPVYFV